MTRETHRRATHADEREAEDEKSLEVPPAESGDMGAGVSPEGVPYQGPSHDWELSHPTQELQDEGGEPEHDTRSRSR